MAQNGQHPVDKRSVGFADRSDAAVLLPVRFPIHGRRDRGFDDEGAAYARDAAGDFGPVHEHLFLWRLVVGNALEGNVGNDAADLFALRVTLAFIDEPAAGTARVVAEFVPLEGCR